MTKPYEDDITAIESDKTNVIRKYALNQNFPNPFNPTTVIQYQLPTDGFVSLIIYNILGERVHTLVDAYKTSGKYSISINGSELKSGVYFYRLSTPDYSATKRMTLIK
jgi:hypothetical protein